MNRTLKGNEIDSLAVDIHSIINFGPKKVIKKVRRVKKKKVRELNGDNLDKFFKRRSGSRKQSSRNRHY